VLALISLIGLPGAGKSSVGIQLARRVGCPFLDSDQVIERRVGMSIKAYFELHGEESFRALESDALAELVKAPSGVLATGGGSVLRASNRLLLRQGTQVVYLRAMPEQLVRRLRHDKSRPLLQGHDPLTRLQELFVARDPLYRDTAHFVFDTGYPTISRLVKAILAQLESSGILPLRSQALPPAAVQGGSNV